MSKFCESPTEESYLNFIRLGHEKDTRTCLVASNSFKRNFRLIGDTGSGAHSWVVMQTSPAGSCGIVWLSRFEPEQMDDTRHIFWKYVAKKAVTNPQGTFLLGGSCKGLDEHEYVYDWRAKEYSLDCDYIKFSAL